MQEHVEQRVARPEGESKPDLPPVSYELSSTSSTSTASLEYRRSHDFYILPIPKRLRYDENKPPNLNLALNLIFAVTSTICECSRRTNYCVADIAGDSCSQSVLLPTSVE